MHFAVSHLHLHLHSHWHPHSCSRTQGNPRLSDLMPRHTISTQPRRGGPSFTSFTSETASLGTSTLSTSSARSPNPSRTCFYCPAVLADDSARRQHIANTPGCTAAERATLQRAEDEERRRAEAAAPAARRRRVVVEEVPDRDAAPQHTVPSSPGPSLPGPSAAGDSSASARVDPEPGPSRPVRTPATGHGRAPPRRLRRRGGLYIEDYPDPLAGAPISDEYAPTTNLAEYMRCCGPMADPEDFEAAELLMTTGLTDTAKDRHLKSSKVSIATY